MNKGQKLVRMLELMSRQYGVRADELLERFELDARSMRRYLADLRELHIPIVDEGKGSTRVLSVDPNWRRSGVQLTLSEVLSLHFGRRLFNFLEGTQFADHIDTALERLGPAISRTNADMARQLDTRFLAVAEPCKDYKGHASDILDDAISALLYNNVVEARYRKASGVEGTYLLHPYTLVTFRQGLYLFAYDCKAGQVKTFAVDRFTELVRRRQEKFEFPTGWKPEAHVANAFGIISGQAHQIRLAFAERVSTYIKERTWHPSQTYRTLPDGRLELTMNVANTVELRTWILGFGRDVEVMEPTGLRDEIAHTIRQAIQQYGA